MHSCTTKLPIFGHDQKVQMQWLEGGILGSALLSGHPQEILYMTIKIVTFDMAVYIFCDASFLTLSQFMRGLLKRAEKVNRLFSTCPSSLCESVNRHHLSSSVKVLCHFVVQQYYRVAKQDLNRIIIR